MMCLSGSVPMLNLVCSSLTAMFATVPLSEGLAAQPVGYQPDALLVSEGSAAQEERPVTQPSGTSWSNALDGGISYYPGFNAMDEARRERTVGPKPSY